MVFFLEFLQKELSLLFALASDHESVFSRFMIPDSIVSSFGDDDFTFA